MYQDFKYKNLKTKNENWYKKKISQRQEFIWRENHDEEDNTQIQRTS